MNDVNSETAQQSVVSVVINERQFTQAIGIKVMGVYLCAWEMHSDAFMIFLPCIMFKMSGVEDRRRVKK